MEAKLCYGCMKAKRESPVCEHCGYDERTQNAPHQLPAGTVLQGKYLLGRVLGQGGFGITYLGRDIALDIPVAIKEYYPTGVVTRESGFSHSVSLATGTEDTRFAENRDRFLREARTLARLEDVPEVVQVKSFFTENNTAYIVMGYVKGITLKEHMRRSGGKISPSEVFRLLKPVLEALGQVHELGLVHRDISPDNIMLQPNKRARLIDFGAAHTATLPGGTSTQAVLKHGFAPVEQYQSKGHLGSWTDVYAMCATIYHCVTGLMPPNATDRMMGEEDFRWEALSCLTEIQQAALRQGLELQYRERIQTMDELCAKLFSQEEPVPQPTPMPEPIPRPQPQPVPEPKPQPKQDEPSVSETGTVALIREETQEAPTAYTAPVVLEEPVFTTPVEESIITTPVEQESAYTTLVQRPESYTTPVEREDSYTAPVERAPDPPVKESAPDSDVTTESATPQNNSAGTGINKLIPIAIAVAVLLVMVLVSFLPNGSTQADAPSQNSAAAQPQSTQAEPLTPLPSEEIAIPVLANPKVTWIVHNDGEGEWYEYDPEINFAFGTAAKRIDISSITFLDTIKDAPADAVDASEQQDGSVLAWLESNGQFYDLYLAADGKIVAPSDCEELFAYFENTTSIHFNDAFVADNVTNMNSMFSGCYALTELDFSGFNTRNVTEMGYMFDFCYSLTELDVSGFDTRNVVWMCGTFRGCSGLTQMDLSGFNTQNVYDMTHMFGYCSSLTELDLSGFDTRNVIGMAAMFEECSNLSKLDISGFDTGNAKNMYGMFRGTNKLKNVEGNFDVHNVDSYEYFMDSGDTFNGRPWEELFQ